MEIEDQNHFSNPRKSRQSNATDSSSIASSHFHLHHHSPPAKSPEYSPARSSVSSDLSSLSHGISPARDPHQEHHHQHQSHSPELTPTPFRPPPSPAPAPVINRYVVEEKTPIKKSDRAAQDGFVSVQGDEETKARPTPPPPPRVRPATARISRTERDSVMKKAALGFRIFEFLFCLVSLSVMATDKNKGWALDSFYRYKEFRYCMSVNVIGFIYSGVQGCYLAYQLATGDYFSRGRLWYYLDFAIDQMLTYLLISASSSAAIRVDDWESNWGKDKFPEVARSSVALSFVAFVAFAFSSLISGYSVCTSRST